LNLFFILRDPEGGPERGPEGGPDGGPDEGGPAFVPSPLQLPQSHTVSLFVAKEGEGGGGGGWVVEKGV
jgi:hypothetical protein